MRLFNLPVSCLRSELNSVCLRAGKNKIHKHLKCCVAVVADTQALVFLLQIQKVVMALGDYMGASCHACIGGTNVRAEVQKLQMEAPHIIVGTPGRVFDMLNRRYLCECIIF